MCRYGVWDMKLGLTQTLKLRFEGVPPCLLLIFYPIITELGSLMFDCTMINIHHVLAFLVFMVYVLPQ